MASVSAYRSPPVSIGYSADHLTNHIQALEEILAKLPEDECIVQLFRTAQNAGFISNETHLSSSLSWLYDSDPQLHSREATGTYPVCWQYSPQGDLYLGMSIYSQIHKKGEVQGFFYRVSKPREPLCALTSTTDACNLNYAGFHIPNSQQIIHDEMAQIFLNLCRGKKFLLSGTPFVARERPADGYWLMNLDSEKKRL